MRFRPAILFCALACVVLTSPSYALDAGDAAPPVNARSVLGGKTVHFDLQQALRHHAVVLYFFPKAFTQG
ncbi:MAG: hypothetical protein M3Z37_11065 [Candidatus Eremiobacteraeota bacterium]|nr:hypothetical protein [Candidatus Eremiobacteraeota bacterium]